MTRSTAGDDGFEQVHQQYATVGDLIEHASIMRRQAAQLAAEADQSTKQALEALRRAKGDLTKLLKEVADGVADHRPVGAP